MEKNQSSTETKPSEISVPENSPLPERGSPEFFTTLLAEVGFCDRNNGESGHPDQPLDYYVETLIEWLGQTPLDQQVALGIAQKLQEKFSGEPGAFMDALFGLTRAGKWQSYVHKNHHMGYAAEKILTNLSPATPLERFAYQAALQELRNDSPVEITAYQNLQVDYGEALRRQVSVDQPLQSDENIYPMATNAAVIVNNRQNVPTEFVYTDPAWQEQAPIPFRLDQLDDIENTVLYRVPEHFYQSNVTHALDAVNKYLEYIYIAKNLGARWDKATQEDFRRGMVESFPEVPQTTWDTLLSFTQESYNDYLIEKSLSEKHLTEKEVLAVDFIKYFLHHSLLATVPKYEIFHIEQDLRNGNIRQSYWRIGQLLYEEFSRHIPKSALPELLQLRQEYDHMSDQIDLARKNLITPKKPLVPESPFMQALQTIDDHWSTLRTKILADVASSKEQLKASLPTTKRLSFDTILENNDARYFGNATTKDDIACVQNFQRPSLILSLQQSLGFHLANLPLRSQVQVVQYLSTVNPEDFAKLQKITASLPSLEAKTAFFTSFVAAAENPKLTYDIISIATNLPNQVRVPVFEKYQKLFEKTETLRITLSDAKAQEHTVMMVSGRILEKANQLLHTVSQLAQAEDQEMIMSLLDQYSEEIVFLTSMCRTLKEAGILDLEAMQGATLKRSTGAELLVSADLDSYHKLLTTAYQKKPAAFRNTITTGFEKSLHKKDVRFYMLHHQEALVAGIRVEDQYDEAGDLTGRYLGSLVSDPHYSGGKIGEALFEKIIENEGRAVVLALHCDPSNAISQKYIEMGFVAKSVELYPGDVPILYTEKSPSHYFQSQHWSKEEVIRASIMNHSPEIQIITTPQGTPPDFSLLNQGFVLTRYFTQGGNCYAVFEQEPLQSATITGSSG